MSVNMKCALNANRFSIAAHILTLMWVAGTTNGCLHQESNLDQLVRSEPFYPLNYGGLVPTVSQNAPAVPARFVIAAYAAMPSVEAMRSLSKPMIRLSPM